MSNPFLLALRPSATTDKLAKIKARTGEVGSTLVSANAGLFCVPSPRAKFNLIPNPFVTDPSIDWTPTNMVFVTHQPSQHLAAWSITTPATATLVSPRGRWHNLGDDHVCNIRIQNYYGAVRTGRVTLRERLTDGSVGSVVTAAFSLNPGEIKDVTLTKTATDWPWFDVMIDNLGSWTAGDSIYISEPHVAPGIVKPTFFAYDTPESEAFPNPGLVDCSPYNSSYGKNQMGSASEVVWCVTPASHQYAVNPYFRNGTTGYTFVGMTSQAVSGAYINWATAGALRCVAAGANSRIVQTLTIPISTINLHAIVFNQSASATFELRVDGVVLASAVIGSKREGELRASFVSNGAAHTYELNGLNTAAAAVWFCSYFGVVDSKQIAIGPLPRQNAAGADALLGTFAGAVDNSAWDSIEPSLVETGLSALSPSFQFSSIKQGALAALYWELPIIGAGTGIARTIADSGAFLRLDGLDVGSSAAKITTTFNGVTSTVTIVDTPATMLLTKTLYQWNGKRFRIDTNYSGVDRAASTDPINPIPSTGGVQSLAVLNQIGGGRPFNGLVSAVLVGERWLADGEWAGLKGKAMWSLDTAMPLSGRMRVKCISTGRMRIRVLGNGQQDA